MAQLAYRAARRGVLRDAECFANALHRDRALRAERLREEREAQLFEHPAGVADARRRC